MRSRISFFEPGVFKNMMRRFWPLWSLYLLLMLFLLPISLGTTDLDGWETISACGLDHRILSGACDYTIVGFLAGGLSAMTVFSYLYQSRSCHMMTSLPTKRGTMFITVYLAGLLPLLAANVIAAGMAMLLGLGNAYIHAVTVLRWLGLVCLNVFSFYSFAAFCAMLTGNILVLPAVYGVLQLTGYALQMSIKYLMQLLCYGCCVGSVSPTIFSPLAKLVKCLQIDSSYSWIMVNNESWYLETSVTLQGTGYVLLYAGLGIVLTAAALLLYRSRRMESAGDPVAIPVLKPVFRYCLSFGCALVIPLVVYDMFFNLSGPASAWYVMVTGVLCAAAGWYAAEMIIQRSLQVFRSRPTGLLVTCGLFLALCVTGEYDLLGVETRMPRLQDIQDVVIGSPYANTYEKAVLSETENIQGLLARHSGLIEAKPTEDDPHGEYISLEYMLKDGSKLTRLYHITDRDLHRQTLALLNTPEAILARFSEDSWMGPDSLVDRNVTYVLIDPNTGEQNWKTLSLTAEQSWDLYQACLADARTGSIARSYLYEEQMQENAHIELNFYFVKGGYDYESSHYLCCTVQRCSVNTLQWLADNTDLDLEAILAWDGTIS